MASDRSPNTEGKVITCKAAVAWGAKEPLKIEEVQVAPPSHGEVRMRVVATSLCRTDLTFWKGEGQTHVFPRIFGHEAAGIVESVGTGVKDVKPGDHVIPLFLGECQNCKYCKSGKTNICTTYKIDTDSGLLYSDKTTRFSKEGKPIFHFLGTSTFSQYTVVDQGCIAKVDRRAPLDKICLLSCGLTTGVGASINTARVEPGSTVAIFGLGTIGFAAAQGAKIAGASKIYGVDINPTKGELAGKFGVTDFLNPLEHNKPISEVIKELTNGGVDYAIECIGNTKLMEAAYESIHDGYGKAVITGLDKATMRLSINPMDFLYGRTLTGSFFGGYKGKSQLNDLVQKYLAKELLLDEYITHEMPFERINEAFELLNDGKCLSLGEDLVDCCDITLCSSCQWGCSCLGRFWSCCGVMLSLNHAAVPSFGCYLSGLAVALLTARKSYYVLASCQFAANFAHLMSRPGLRGTSVACLHATPVLNPITVFAESHYTVLLYGAVADTFSFITKL